MNSLARRSKQKSSSCTKHCSVQTHSYHVVCDQQYIIACISLTHSLPQLKTISINLSKFDWYWRIASYENLTISGFILSFIDPFLNAVYCVLRYYHVLHGITVGLESLQAVVDCPGYTCTSFMTHHTQHNSLLRLGLCDAAMVKLWSRTPLFQFLENWENEPKILNILYTYVLRVYTSYIPHSQKNEKNEYILMPKPRLL